MSGDFWSAERFERVLALKAEGLSASQIGRALGVTRNAVCGKLFREGVGTPAADYAAWRRREAERERARRAAVGDPVKRLIWAKPKAAKPEPKPPKPGARPGRILALCGWLGW